jgi:hypothetical protein
MSNPWPELPEICPLCTRKVELKDVRERSRKGKN